MKIFDCFMYFDEETVLELRLNILNKYVDYFVVVESSFTTKGATRELQFNHQTFKTLKDQLLSVTYADEPANIQKNQITAQQNEARKSFTYIKTDIFKRTS